ncbi:putative aminotransferase ACS12 [Bienertia sinuspersici]
MTSLHSFSSLSLQPNNTIIFNNKKLQKQASKPPAMRLIVPLQGVVQGRGGLILGSIIPCALFYFFQLYFKKNRNNNNNNNRPSSQSSSSPPTLSPTNSNVELRRSSSRPSLSSSRSSLGPACISSRASGLARPDHSPYYMGLDRARADAFHEVDNPDGVIQLGLAENLLSLDLIEKWVAENWDGSMVINGELGINGIATYQPFDGSMDLKMAMADFMSKVLGDVSFDLSHLLLTCVRTGVELIPIHCRSSDNFTLSISALEQAYNNARKRSLKVRGILFSNPSNPIGNLLSKDTLYSLLDFAREKNIHIISDEIFAGSIYGNEEFVSMAKMVESEEFDKDRVHIIYGLSKDLSLAGFRVGAIYTSNENVLAAAKKQARFSSISAPTQRLVASMLSDTKFIEEYKEINGKRLKRVHDMFVAGLDKLGVPCAKGDGGLYCWANFSGLIKPFNEKGELDLWDKLLTVGKVNLTPGSAFHCIEPGWFRCCFTAVPEKAIPLVMERIRRVCEICKSSS